MTIFTEKNPLLGEKLVNGPGHLKDAQSATGPSSWMDNTDIMHFRPLFSLSRTPRLDLRKQHSVNICVSLTEWGLLEQVQQLLQSVANGHSTRRLECPGREMPTGCALPRATLL